SVTMELSRRGTTLHLIVHPVFAVTREADGTLRTLAARHDAPQAPRESWMHLEIDRLPEADQRAALLADIERVLQDVRAAVTDFAPMLARLRAAADELEATAPTSIAEEAREGAAFLRWLADEHLVLLGSLQHELVLHEGVEALRLVPGSGLGLLREPAGEPISASFAALTPAMRAVARQPAPPVIVTKANTRSTVHRPGYTDYIGVKRFDAQGRVVGEHRFIGLLTSTAYMARVAEIPILRGKVAAVRARAGLTPGGHLDKALAHILETYPRDELFQITVDELYQTALGILRLGQRQKLRLFVRRDPFERFVSCLVYVPRDAYHTELRRKFQELLLQAFAGTQADFDVLLTEAILARVHFVVRTTPGAVPAVDLRRLEQRLAAVARRWDDDLRDALVEARGEAQGLALFRRWAGAFPAAYRERTPPAAAVTDLLHIDALGEAQPVALSFYRPLGAQADRFGFKVYRRGQPLALAESLPMLEHLGVKVLAEARHAIGAGTEAVWLHDFALQAQLPEDMELEAIARRFEECFLAVLDGRVEDDDFNRLVLRAALSAREIVILRAYARYFRQIGFALSQRFIETTLAAHPQIARMLVRLFGLRFDPAAADAEAEQRQAQAIEAALARVADLSEDRVLRQYLAAIRSTVRTNYWRTGVGSSGAPGPWRPFLSFKFDGARMPGLPPPRPYAEIFVYSPRFEGVHLRGGKVARGGIRWSDRPEDFRTEVLGLMKAQMVKNTVIVPVGSKGGFVLKRAPADRDALLAEGVACYQDYLRGLLDLTDNRQGDRVLPPPQVVRHDDDDPYLVVAADKGTATFSDYANAVAREYGFWLGDAFASGGSAGYDHKKMGITARGAWESVKRHFRELGIDTQRTDFTVVGIGDMSGDVFGNGMLLSRHIKLVAAFDHRHIF
ncbi:MAG: NAD-glutamate dehydrogenase, partial [Burkholderiaceae bacterium]|nr:NAD-glutamate dehydrogenase [Burkholderiaceae bacterium]